MSFINWIFVLSILESLLRLHKSVCDNRNVATIATHDFSKVYHQNALWGLISFNSGSWASRVYSSRAWWPLYNPPLFVLSSQGLNKAALEVQGNFGLYQADRLVDNLKNEAEALRKEKKRSQVSYEEAEFLIYKYSELSHAFLFLHSDDLASSFISGVGPAPLPPSLGLLASY